MSSFSLQDCGLPFIVSSRGSKLIGPIFQPNSGQPSAAARNDGQSLRGISCKRVAVADSESMKMYEKLRKTKRLMEF
jgi:hypothetical protein